MDPSNFFTTKYSFVNAKSYLFCLPPVARLLAPMQYNCISLNGTTKRSSNLLKGINQQQRKWSL